MEWFGGRVPQDVLKEWSAGGSRQLIGQAEFLPVALARALWRDRLRDRSAICFVDNEAARVDLIKAFSPNVASARMIELVTHLDIGDATLTGYERVPSESNVADPPSRDSAPPQIEGWRPVERIQISDADCRTVALGVSSDQDAV